MSLNDAFKLWKKYIILHISREFNTACTVYVAHGATKEKAENILELLECFYIGNLSFLVLKTSSSYTYSRNEKSGLK